MITNLFNEFCCVRTDSPRYRSGNGIIPVLISQIYDNLRKKTNVPAKNSRQSHQNVALFVLDAWEVELTKKYELAIK